MPIAVAQVRIPGYTLPRIYTTAPGWSLACCYPLGGGGGSLAGHTRPRIYTAASGWSLACCHPSGGGGGFLAIIRFDTGQHGARPCQRPHHKVRGAHKPEMVDHGIRYLRTVWTIDPTARCMLNKVMYACVKTDKTPELLSGAETEWRREALCWGYRRRRFNGRRP